jgi:hypothetical protein
VDASVIAPSWACYYKFLVSRKLRREAAMEPHSMTDDLHRGMRALVGWKVTVNTWRSVFLFATLVLVNVV